MCGALRGEVAGDGPVPPAPAEELGESRDSVYLVLLRLIIPAREDAAFQDPCVVLRNCQPISAPTTRNVAVLCLSLGHF